MIHYIQKPGLETVADRRWQSYANVTADGGTPVPGMNVIPADFAFDRCDSLATNSGEPMT